MTIVVVEVLLASSANDVEDADEFIERVTCWYKSL